MAFQRHRLFDAQPHVQHHQGDRLVVSFLIGLRLEAGLQDPRDLLVGREGLMRRCRRHPLCNGRSLGRPPCFLCVLSSFEAISCLASSLRGSCHSNRWARGTHCPSSRAARTASASSYQYLSSGSSNSSSGGSSSSQALRSFSSSAQRRSSQTMGLLTAASPAAPAPGRRAPPGATPRSRRHLSAAPSVPARGRAA